MNKALFCNKPLIINILRKKIPPSASFCAILSTLKGFDSIPELSEYKAYEDMENDIKINKIILKHHSKRKIIFSLPKFKKEEEENQNEIAKNIKLIMDLFNKFKISDPYLTFGKEFNKKFIHYYIHNSILTNYNFNCKTKVKKPNDNSEENTNQLNSLNLS